MIADPHLAAPREPEAPGGQRSHLAHRVLERNQPLVARVVAEHARKRAPEARMRQRIVRQAVGAHHRRRVRQDPAHVVLRHVVIHGARRLQPARRVLLGHAPLGGDRPQQLARHFRMRIGPRDRDVDVARRLLDVERRRAAAVRIAVAADGLDAPRALERREHFGAAPPVRRPRALQMRDHDGHACMPADAVGLVHRLEDRIELGAHVRRVDGARVRERLGERHHLLGRRGERGAVREAAGKTERAVRERLLELRAHRRDFGAGRRAVEPVHLVAAQRGVADERRDVDGRLRRAERVDIGGERRIAKRRARAEQVHRIGRIALERDGRRADPAVADDHRRHALRDLRQHLRRVDHVRVVVRVHVDEAGRERAAVRLDHLLRKPVRQIADRDDAVAAYRDVALDARRARAVVQLRADDQRIGHFGMRVHVSLLTVGARRRRGACRARASSGAAARGNRRPGAARLR
ncbi:hypothetical protein BURPS1710b_0836 [Burkholderia pseudomallei 1710b]|uniref:Uncharacterized protein n=1 Tax=Burkholderia pseudomallei (strain 1710b) TaxID=320372 RepID=Q3JW04_BURP1|nr:hypothetical protein BURPS1710b_0836 [Burkholderia pseudomallei 1710b]